MNRLGRKRKVPLFEQQSNDFEQANQNQSSSAQYLLQPKKKQTSPSLRISSLENKKHTPKLLPNTDSSLILNQQTKINGSNKTMLLNDKATGTPKFINFSSVDQKPLALEIVNSNSKKEVIRENDALLVKISPSKTRGPDENASKTILIHKNFQQSSANTQNVIGEVQLPKTKATSINRRRISCNSPIVRCQSNHVEASKLGEESITIHEEPEEWLSGNESSEHIELVGNLSARGISLIRRPSCSTASSSIDCTNRNLKISRIIPDTIDLTKCEENSIKQSNIVVNTCLNHCDLCTALFKSHADLIRHRQNYHNVDVANMMGIPIIDLTQQDIVEKITKMGFTNYIYLPSSNKEAKFALPVVPMNALAKLTSSINSCATSVISLGPMQNFH